MMEHRTHYAWGVCMLGHLYHDLHQAMYDGGTSLSTRLHAPTDLVLGAYSYHMTNT